MRTIVKPWGEANGRPVHLIELETEALHALVSTYGGILQSLKLRDPQGRWLDAVLGCDTLEEYLRGDAFFGAMIGPLADRVAGGRFLLDGREVCLPRNAGPDSMHCGTAGFHRKVWNWAPLERGIRLFCTFDENDTGFPGRMSVEIRCLVSAPRTLRLEYASTCTRQTTASFTNHSYFNLTGGRSDCLGHVLTIHADTYAETERDSEPICTGRTPPVDDTPLDLRAGVRVGDAVERTSFREIAVAGGIDHYFPVAGTGLRELASLRCPETGLTLRCRSDAPGLLVYTGNGLSGECGKGGQRYGRHWGVCLETERFPNAVNQPERRASVLLEPGEAFGTVTEFSFSFE